MKTSVLIIVVMVMMMLVMSSSAAAVAAFVLWTPPTTPPPPTPPPPPTTPPPPSFEGSSPVQNEQPPSKPPKPKPKPQAPTTSNPQPPQIPNPNPGAGGAARGLLEPHNAYRKTHGVPDLLWSDDIAAIAQRNVDWQSSQGVWGHQAWDAGMIPRDMGIGAENSAAGTEDLTNRWYRSPGHQANMLNPEATHMGCGLSFVTPQAVCIFAKQ